ncbi:MAG: cation:proton antiporter [Nitrososphaeria archaeon]
MAFALGELCKKVGIPPVIGQILGGMLFGIPFFQHMILVDESSVSILNFLSDLGIMFLLFLVGLEIDIEKIKETSRDSVLISFSSALLPFLLGFTFIQVFFPQYGFLTALVFGGALMVTSEGTKVKVLIDLNSLNTRLGAVMVAAGAIDDIFEVLFLSIVVVMAHGGTLVELASIPLELVAFTVVAFASFKIISKALRYLDKNGSKDETELFSMVVIFVLTLAALSEALQVGYLIGAIIAGFLLQISMKGIIRQHKRDMIKVTKLITLSFVVPFFFANVGINFDLTALFSNVGLLLVTLGIASVGKIAGTIMVKPLSILNLKQLYYVGWGMNSRGAAELVIALIAVRYGLIPLEVFSALVAMSLITTLVFPLVLARGIRGNPGLMNRTSTKRNINHRIKMVKQGSIDR